MNRRSFIKTTALAGIGTALLGSTIISCSGNNFSLKEIIGKSESILEKFPKEGNQDFAYYIISNFKDGLLSGEQVFVFCEQGKISGYTIKVKGTGEVEKLIKNMDNDYGTKIQTFTNGFGEEYKWIDKERKISLCYSKPYPNIPKYTFYSESLAESKLIVF